MDLLALMKLTYGLYVVGAKNDNKMGGCIVNTVMQVTHEKAKIITVISKGNFTHQMIVESNKYTVSVLAKGTPMDIIAAFGFKSSQDTDKFNEVQYKLAKNEVPYLTEHTLAVYSCKVVQTVDVGTHTIFVGEIEEAFTLSSDDPLTYAYYKEVKKGTVPRNAPTYKETRDTSGTYKCTICNYIYDGTIPFEELSEDYKCPICKKTKGYFIKIAQ